MSAVVTELKQRYATTKDKMICNECHDSISAGSSAVKAGGKFWHPEHFACRECGTHLRMENESNPTVFQKDGSLYCEVDYKHKFVPKCAYCFGFIMKVGIIIVFSPLLPRLFSFRVRIVSRL